jgi:hypothetical protein
MTSRGAAAAPEIYRFHEFSNALLAVSKSVVYEAFHALMS